MPGRPRVAARTARERNAILLVGAGRMGTALLKGWISNGLAPIVVAEPAPSRELRALARREGVALRVGLTDIEPRAISACVIAVKPQIVGMVASGLKPFAESGALLLSIAAGTRVASLKTACGRNAQVVRAMPNLPGAVGCGISALYAPRDVTQKRRILAETLLAALGQTFWIGREKEIDAVTAVSGSGPAYVFLMVEALARAAANEGIPQALALKLARATVTGAAALLKWDARPAAQLRREVTSPGGTTEAAMAVLMRRDAFPRLMAQAVRAARQRAEALSR